MKILDAPPCASSPLRRFWKHAPNTVFLNHGSFGACPEPIQKLQSELRLQMEAEPIQFLWRHYEEHLEPSRQALAQFLGTASKDLVFVTNTTSGVNAVVRSLDLKPGDELLATNLDYNACHNVLLEAARRAGARVVVAPIPFPLKNPDQIVSAILDHVTPRTRLALIDHITSDTAIVLPVARIIKELEDRHVDTLIDGAHAPGMVPIPIQKLRPAYYTGNLHKWVCAPKGAAFLYAREDLQDAIQPAVISHGNNRPRPGYTPFQDRFDWPGTFDPTAWMCVGEAIHWLANLIPGGWNEVRKTNHSLAVQARRLLCRELGVKPPCPESMLGSLATIPLPVDFPEAPRTGKLDVEQEQLYDEFGIEVPFNRCGTPPMRCFRVSAQVYNCIEEYRYLADTLKTLMSRETKVKS
jgi:isopenicillin-N epimerase